MDYYEYMGLIKRINVENKLGFKNNINISFIRIPQEKNVDIFLFEQNGKKLIYSPCDCKIFPENENLYNTDILIIGNTFIGDVLKNGTIIHEKHPLRQELHSMENIMEIKEKADMECGNCGCEYDPLYKKVLQSKNILVA